LWHSPLRAQREHQARHRLLQLWLTLRRYMMWNRETRRQVIDGKEHGQQGKGSAAGGNAK
jgi:outer membrane PBP1 activator LpoA protein